MVVATGKQPSQLVSGNILALVSGEIFLKQSACFSSELKQTCTFYRFEDTDINNVAERFS